MNIFQKQSTHKMGGSILLTVLLSVAVFLSSLCVAAWNVIHDQFSRLEQGYTTFAVHAGNNMKKLAYSQTEEHLGENGIQTINWAEEKEFFGQDSCAFPDGSQYSGPIDAASAASASPYALEIDQRLLLSAHVEGITPLSTGRLDYLEYIQEMDQYCYNASVAALECVEITPETSSLADLEELGVALDEYTNFTTTYVRTVTFRIIDWVSRSDAYDLPPEEDLIQIYTSLVDESCGELFQVGKTYLVRGFYRDYPVSRDSHRVIREVRDGEYQNKYRQMDVDMLLFPDDNRQHFDFKTAYSEVKDQIQYHGHYVHDEMWPVVSEYTGSWEEFLETEAGKVWKDEIIPFTRVNQNSAPVILTDRLESIYGFIVGEAHILEGRTFTEEEYSQGNRVCLISEQYAELNDLEPGDTISLDLYDTGAETKGYSYNGASRSDGLCRYPMTGSTQMGIKEDYTIVGIYTSPGLRGSLHDFGNDTIFVPKESVPGWEQCTIISHPFLSSAMIQNGSIDAFENDMTAAGLPEAYQYYDQGYSELEDYLQTLIHNAQSMLAIGLPLFVLVTLSFLLLDGKRRNPVIRALRLLGVKRGEIWRQSLSAVLGMVLVAILLGNTLAVLLFRQVMAGVLSAGLELKIGYIVLSATAQTLFISALAAVWMSGAVNRSLLKRK